MRTSGLALATILAFAVPGFAQQPPLGTLAPPAQPRELLSPRTVVPALVACADLPTTEGAITPTHWVVSPHAGDHHTASAKDQVVVLNGGTTVGLNVGQRYFTRRWQPPIHGEEVSAAAHASIRTTGWLTVIASDHNFALGRVDYNCDSVEANDYLEPYVEPKLPATMPVEAPTNFSDLGKVMLGVDRRQSFAAGDFLNIDRGANKGATLGMRVAFYRDRHNGTPLFELGFGVVVEVSPETSKVVLQRVLDEIRAGDYYGIRNGTP